MTQQITYVIIAGDSNYGDYTTFCKEMDHALSKSTSVEMHIPQLYGSGAEKLAQLYSTERNYTFHLYPLQVNNKKTFQEIIKAIKMAGGTRMGVMLFGSSEATIQLVQVCEDLGIKCRTI